MTYGGSCLEPYHLFIVTNNYVLQCQLRGRKVAKPVINFIKHVCSSVRLFAWSNSARTGRCFMKLFVYDFSILYG